jgi:hypothetical protein
VNKAFTTYLGRILTAHYEIVGPSRLRELQKQTQKKTHSLDAVAPNLETGFE